MKCKIRLLLFVSVAISTALTTYAIHRIAAFLVIEPLEHRPIDNPLNQLQQRPPELPTPNKYDEFDDWEPDFDIETMKKDMGFADEDFAESKPEEMENEKERVEELMRLLEKEPVPLPKVQCTIKTATTPANDTQLWCGGEHLTCRELEADGGVAGNEEEGEESGCPPRLLKPTKNYNCTGLKEWLDLMDRRKKHLARACEQKSIYTIRTGAPKELFHFDKVGNDGISWCPVYKAGSSNTNSYFCPLYYKPEVCLDRRRNGANLWRHSQHWAPDAPGIVPRFLIVRHPLERLLSAYRDKVQTPSEPLLGNIFGEMIAKHRFIPPHLLPRKEDLLSQAQAEAKTYLRDSPQKGLLHYSTQSPGNPYTQPLSATFKEFLNSIVMGNHNEHWATVDEFCSPCSPAAHYNYILHVEDLDCEFNNMLSIVEAEHLMAVHTEYFETNINPARRGSRYTDLYEFYAPLPDRLLELVYEWYRPDCELFGYDCQKTLCEIREWRERFMGKTR